MRFSFALVRPRRRLQNSVVLRSKSMAFNVPSSGSMTGPAGATDRSLLIDDAAVLLGVSRRTVYYRISQGHLETVRTRVGSQRVLLTSIERLLRMQRGMRRVAWIQAAAE
jgi:excisionase family DNA binding protein